MDPGMEKMNAPDRTVVVKRRAVPVTYPTGGSDNNADQARLEKENRRNMERCAAFVARMIEKYGREVLAEIEAEEKQGQ